MAETRDGLFNRYTVEKTSGKPVDPDAEYFVLRLDENGKDPEHINAGREAIMLYASLIESKFPQLAVDLRKKYNTRLDGKQCIYTPCVG